MRIPETPGRGESWAGSAEIQIFIPIFDSTVLCEFCLDSNILGCFEKLLLRFIHFCYLFHPGWRQTGLAAGLAAERGRRPIFCLNPAQTGGCVWISGRHQRIRPRYHGQGTLPVHLWWPAGSLGTRGDSWRARRGQGVPIWRSRKKNT